MKSNLYLPVIMLTGILLHTVAFSQQYNCFFKPPVLKIDFGNNASTSAIHLPVLDNYEEDDGACPQDGYYSIISHTSDCFMGNWITLTEDHTPGDVGGNMMIVNAANEPGTFFSYPVSNILPNTTYEISVWIINICTGDNGCYPTPPNLRFNILNGNGLPVVIITTGDINPIPGGRWLRYHAQFTTPANVANVQLKMNDATQGGCGNDFAIDDIEIRECIPPPPPPPVTKVTTVNKQTTTVARPSRLIPKPVAAKPSLPALKRTPTVINNESAKPAAVAVKPAIKDIPAAVPEILLSRTNTLVKTIETPEADMLIELYDNGEIDGDTVTVYHNNKLLVANAGLSEKPVRFKIKVDKQHPHHDLVMVANNLGSIPPNTSLMVITANDKRYELFISSTEQKNARIVIELKE